MYLCFWVFMYSCPCVLIAALSLVLFLPAAPFCRRRWHEAHYVWLFSFMKLTFYKHSLFSLLLRCDSHLVKGVLTLFFFLPFLFSCNTDDSNLTCSEGSKLSTLNISFYDKDSSNFTSISVDSILVTINNDTLVDVVSASNISLSLSPIDDSTVFSFISDSSDAIAATLTVKYDCLLYTSDAADD